MIKVEEIVRVKVNEDSEPMYVGLVEVKHGENQCELCCFHNCKKLCNEINCEDFERSDCKSVYAVVDVYVPLGERLVVDSDVYECKFGRTCDDCAFSASGHICALVSCLADSRRDGNTVIFVKVP